MIEVEAGEQIDSITIRNATNGGDTIYLDHIAFEESATTAPEPGTLTIFGLGPLYWALLDENGQSDHFKPV